ncbi:MAG TPA: hypothetical protein VLV78_22885 [Thermoanaerobaculia bacterium]|nr:hypothetical protein [Thermoanaerobaculia bacterium]
MRVLSRVALVVIVALSAVPLFADHLQADCPLTLVGNHPAGSDFNLSPHGVFRSGSQVFVLRGQILSTYTISDLGDLPDPREDFIGSLGARETTGGTAFSGGFLYVSSEAGLEIFDVRNVRAGGSAPALVSRTPGLHYRRLAVNGNTLAALYPMTDMPCYPNGTSFCFNTIDLFDVSNKSVPFRTGSISSLASRSFLGWNDIAFNQGFLFAAGEGGTVGFNISNPATPVSLGQIAVPGKFLISNSTTLLAVGNDQTINIYNVALSGAISLFQVYVLPFETIQRANPIAFHRQGFIDEQNGRMVTMVDEIDPETLMPARTVAIDVFDFTVPLWEGSYERIYENVSYTAPDEVKYNPMAVGPVVYVVGSLSGLQTYGACGQMAGKIEWDGTQAINCDVPEIRGWVTGDQKIANVELFLDGGSIGTTTVGGPPRKDVSSRTPVFTWRINFDKAVLNSTSDAPVPHTLRAVGTDALGNRRQFASQPLLLFKGSNCTTRRRSVAPR